jgi:hypothetical protein
MTQARHQFEKLFGDLGLKDSDAAWLVFLAGWNAALTKASQDFELMPFGDTSDSTAIYLKGLQE